MSSEARSLINTVLSTIPIAGNPYMGRNYTDCTCAGDLVMHDRPQAKSAKFRVPKGDGIHQRLNFETAQDGKKFYLPLTFAMDSVEACPIIANDQSLVALLMAGCIELKPATHTAEVTLSGVKFEIKRSGPGHNKCNVIGPELMSKLGLAISYAED